MSLHPKKRAVPADQPGPASGAAATGSLALDLALGTLGWPRGRIVEIFGTEGCGKTTLLLEAIAHAQQNNGLGALIDADHATDQATAERVGVNWEAMPFHRTSSLEEAFEKIAELVDGGAVDVIGLDGIAALLPEGHQTCSRDTVPPSKSAEHQHRIGYFLRALLGPLSRSRAVLLITNQVVEKLGVIYGNPETTPWETMPLRNYASQRVELRRLTTIKNGNDAIGAEVKAKIVKNRLAAPFVDATFELHFATGISYESDLINLGIDSGVVAERGNHLSVGEQSLGANRGTALRQLEQDVELAAQLRQSILERRRP
jgi:recombination protein RecA